MLQQDTIPEFVLQILSEEAYKHDTTIGDILEGCQTRHVVKARWATIKRLRGRPSTPSTLAIGRWLGLNHATVLYALRGGRK